MSAAEHDGLVEIVKGNPTPEQIAAITAVITAKAAAVAAEKNVTRDEWGQPAELLAPRWASASSFYNRLW
ncbi:MAG: acyl-CoA carboxylase epsilon subunit [Gordonia sp. (in: high G+C Gram-positive bacteria)]|uniref:acyl-CoA carboxylase epsilon subunit n=1 Tax=Gordonia sp. (in: high G+C Gram-positive bacteria) TaxID=84139 RepID=UPI0039E61133